MRIAIVLGLLLTLLLPLGRRPGFATAASDFPERIVNGDAANAYPRWMTKSTIPDFAGCCCCLDVDSYDRPHLVGLGTDPSTGRTDILYTSGDFAKRETNGFTPPEVVSSSNGQSLSKPTMVVDRNDNVHVVWSQGIDNQDFFEAKQQPLYYRMRGPNGWGPITQIGPLYVRAYGAISRPTRPVTFSTVCIKEDAHGAIHIVGQLIFRITQSCGGPASGQDVYRLFHMVVGGGYEFIAQEKSLATEYVSGPRNIRATSTKDGRLYTWWQDEDGNWESLGTFMSQKAQVVSTFWPNLVEFDSKGARHMISANRYRIGFTGTEETLPLVPDRMIIDERDQIHLFAGTMYAMRRRSPLTGAVDPVWRTQNIAPGGTVVRGRRGGFHSFDGSAYTRTLEFGTGATDPSGLIGAFPGGTADAISGNLRLTVPLFATDGVAPAQSAGLTYNTLAPFMDYVAPGWSLGWGLHVIEHGPNQFTLILPDGRPVGFSGGKSSPESGVSAILERPDPQAKPVRITTADGRILSFNEKGKISRIAEPTQNWIDFVYDDGGRLVEVWDQRSGQSSGRGSRIEYLPNSDKRVPSRISRITDPAGASYSFTYAAKELKRITYDAGPGTPAYDFTYYPRTSYVNGVAADLLATVAPPGLGTWKVRYLPDGRFMESLDPAEEFVGEDEDGSISPAASQAKLSFEFDESLPVTATRETKVTTRRGFLTKYKVQPRLNRVLEFHDPDAIAGKAGISPIVRSFDAYGNPVTVKDRWGNTTAYDYVDDSRMTGKLVSKVSRPAPAGAGTEEVASFTYTTDGFNRVKTATTKATRPESGLLSRTTTYEHDAYGQVTRIVLPPASLASGGSQTADVTFEYLDARHRLTKVTDPEGGWTRFAAFDPGCGLPVTIERVLGTQPATVRYDIMGNLVQSTAPQGGSANDAVKSTVYDLDGLYRTVFVTDPANSVTTITYDAASRVTSVTPPTGTATITTYDSRGFATGGVAPDGAWAQSVDADGNVRRSVDYRGNATTSKLDYFGRPLEIRGRGGPVGGQQGGGVAVELLKYAYDEWDGTLRTGRTIQAMGTDETRARTSTTVYDRRGRATAVKLPDGQTEQRFTYDEQDRVIAASLYQGVQFQTCSVTFRDERDRVFRVRRQNSPYPGGADKSSNAYAVYDKAGRVVRTVDPLGSPTSGNAHTIQQKYDLRGRPTEWVDGKGVTVRRVDYGEDDLPTAMFAPDPSTKSATLIGQATYAYTARKELKSTTNRFSVVSKNEYGPLPGQVIRVLGPLGRNTRIYYGSHHRPTEIVEAEGTSDAASTYYDWEFGQLKSTTVFNPKSGSYDAVFGREYDAGGRISKLTYPAVDGAQTPMAPEVFTYNGFGELALTVAGTRKVNHGYDSLGRAVSTQWSGSHAATQATSYTAAGHVASTTSNGTTISREYDLWNGAVRFETHTIEGKVFKSTTRDTDVAGNLVALTDPEGKKHEWPVDENNRPLSKSYDGKAVTSLKYTPGGQLDSETLHDAAGNGMAVTLHTYDSLGRKSAMDTWTISGGRLLSDYRYDYNDADEVVLAQELRLGISTTYAYNARGWLIREATAGNGNGAAVPPNPTQTGAAATGNESGPTADSVSVQFAALQSIVARTSDYEYHKNGARKKHTLTTLVNLTLTTTVTDYEVNALGQLTRETSPAGTVAHAYDAWGNETRRTPSTGAASDYAYNHLNLLSQFTSGATNVTYSHWPSGLRLWKGAVGGSSRDATLPSLGNGLCDYTQTGSSAPALKNTFVSGQGLDSAAQRIAANGDRRHLLGDSVNTMGATLDGSGAPVETIVRDAFGMKFGGSSTEPVGFAGARMDDESGLVYLRNRMYDPSTGRFLQNDPIRGNRPSSHYTYASNNPQSYVDPEGLQDVPQAVKDFPQAKRDFGGPRAQLTEQRMKDLRRQWSDLAKKSADLEPGAGSFLVNLATGGLLVNRDIIIAEYLKAKQAEQDLGRYILTLERTGLGPKVEIVESDGLERVSLLEDPFLPFAALKLAKFARPVLVAETVASPSLTSLAPPLAATAGRENMSAYVRSYQLSWARMATAEGPAILEGKLIDAAGKVAAQNRTFAAGAYFEGEAIRMKYSYSYGNIPSQWLTGLGEQVPYLCNHAERSLLLWSSSSQSRIQWMGASKDACTFCGPDLNWAGIPLSTGRAMISNTPRNAAAADRFLGPNGVMNLYERP